MRRSFLKASCILFCISFLLQTSVVRAAEDIIHDMVKLDQAYIPALAFTSEEKLGPSREAMKSLNRAWNSFNTRYQSDSHGDAQWKPDFDKIDSYIGAADKIVIDGKNIKDAHEELEHVRIVLMHLRERNHIEYFVDNLTRFHKPMEEIVLSAKDKDDATLKDEDIEHIRIAFPIAKNLWKSTSAAKFDAFTYGFDSTRAAKLHNLIEKETQSLERLEKAIKGRNKKEIIGAAIGIKPNFAQIFKLFGRFPKT